MLSWIFFITNLVAIYISYYLHGAFSQHAKPLQRLYYIMFRCRRLLYSSLRLHVHSYVNIFNIFYIYRFVCTNTFVVVLVAHVRINSVRCFRVVVFLLFECVLYIWSSIPFFDLSYVKLSNSPTHENSDHDTQNTCIIIYIEHVASV